MKLFDSHAHYNDRRFEEEYPGGLDKVIQDSFEADVVGFITVGTEPNNCRKAIEIAEKYHTAYAAVGLHPEDAAAFEKTEISSVVEDICSLLSHEKVVALGEIGLDYHWDTPRDIQKEVFDMQLCIAEEKNIPVIIHDREAHGDIFDILCSHKNVCGVMHCYSGSAEMARDYVRRGWYISFAGPVSYKNAENVRNACRSVPQDRLLIETDCPYLAPVPHRGKINYSGYMVHTLAAMAAARGEDEEELARATIENSKKLFNIEI
ncbi:MAG: TatD family hydrolase [Clostridia bacterium]|nr:TatD family hydrolase [Clostridia bacterium]